jgi:hypothetical protein
MAITTTPPPPPPTVAEMLEFYTTTWKTGFGNLTVDLDPGRGKVIKRRIRIL